MATTYAYYAGGKFNGQLISSTQQTSTASTEGGFFTISNELDLSAGHSATNNGTAVAKTGTDTFELIAIPANTHVLNAYGTVLTAEGDAGTMDLGTVTSGPNDVDCFIDGLDINGAAGTTTASGAAANGLAAGGYFYSAADTVELLGVTGTANSAAKVRITLLCFSPVV